MNTPLMCWSFVADSAGRNRLVGVRPSGEVIHTSPVLSINLPTVRTANGTVYECVGAPDPAWLPPELNNNNTEK